jgi:hypothetical protein
MGLAPSRKAGITDARGASESAFQADHRVRSGHQRPARVAAVISSPDLGVFAVTAAGPGPRRGHVICSGVFAVAAVAAAGISCPGHPPACPATFAQRTSSSLIGHYGK